MTEKIANSILECVGHTPLVRIQRLNPGKAELLAKVEALNPGGSSKDRVGVAMIEEAERQGKLLPGGTIIEPTSGNTGVGLAVAAAVKGYHLILTMPDSMSLERRQLLAVLGAEIVLTKGAEGMAGSIRKANELQQAISGSFIPQQFENSANPRAHEKSTALEIWEDTDGKVDAFVAGVGTGGTLMGVARVLKARNPGVKIVAVEPWDSQVLAGRAAAPHKLQGIGANFVPGIVERALIDEIIPVKSEDAGKMTVALARQEGILAGITSGAALWAGVQLSQRPEFAGKRIVVLLPDTGTRYLSGWPFVE